MGTLIRRTTAATAVLALLLVLPTASADEALPGCAPADAAGGEWPSYGHDLSNTRHQPEEDVIGPAEVAGLEPAWVVDAAGGIFNNTPIVADGCVYLVSSDGWARAVDADTGAEAWATQLAISQPGFGGGVVGSPAVSGDDLLVIVNQHGAPYVAALDRTTGTERWLTVLDTQPAAMTNASVVVHDGVVLAGFSGNAGPGTPERGGFVLLDAADGAELAKTFSIPDDEFEAGYAGGGVWSTAAVDTETGLAYLGTSNPHSSQQESDHTNAILAVDLDRSRSTFGQILDHYKGRPDTYVDGLADQPVCDTAPEVYYVDRFSATCLQIDLDFGASPNLWVDPATGQTMVGDLQKAGVYHAFDAATMGDAARWETVVGVPCLACNAASGSVHDGRVFTAAGPPGQLFSLDADSGVYQWAGHLTGPTSYNAVSSANGVVYVTDAAGSLNAFDEATGRLLVKRNLADDTGSQMFAATSSSGVAVARNTVYVAHGSFAIAYRLADGGGGGGLPELPAPELPAPPGPAGGAAFAAGPGAFATTYATPVVVMAEGSGGTFVNADPIQHDVIADDGSFSSELIGVGSTPVTGVEALAPGEYGFYCSLHPNMQGTLVVR